MTAVEWVVGSSPGYLIAILLLCAAGVLGLAWAEHRQVDPWDALARRDRKRARR